MANLKPSSLKVNGFHLPLFQGQEPLNSRELAAASPQEQKQIIWGRLYPLIQLIHPDQAGKLTDMLLEIDNAELLHVLESRKALGTKALEVVSVLRTYSTKEKSEEKSEEKKMVKKKSAKKKNLKIIVIIVIVVIIIIIIIN